MKVWSENSKVKPMAMPLAVKVIIVVIVIAVALVVWLASEFKTTTPTTLTLEQKLISATAEYVKENLPIPGELQWVVGVREESPSNYKAKVVVDFPDHDDVILSLKIEVWSSGYITGLALVFAIHPSVLRHVTLVTCPLVA